MTNWRECLAAVSKEHVDAYFKRLQEATMSEPNKQTTLAELVSESYGYAAGNGFHDYNETNRFNAAEKLALIHSEISEALEEVRAGRPVFYTDPKSGKPEGWGIELVDALIRIGDFFGVMQRQDGTAFNLQRLYEIKRDFNHTRPYKHGKRF